MCLGYSCVLLQAKGFVNSCDLFHKYVTIDLLIYQYIYHLIIIYIYDYIYNYIDINKDMYLAIIAQNIF